MKRNLLLIIFSFLIGTYCQAQNLERLYEYDNSGNRIVRKVLTVKNMKIAEDENSEIADEMKSFSEKIGEFNISIFPNPTTSKITLEISDYPDLINGKISLFTLSGQLIREMKITSDKLEIDLSSYANGMYLIRLDMNDHKDEWKIIKQ